MLASVWTLSCHCPVKLFTQYQPCIIVCYICSMSALSVLFFFTDEHNVLMVLLFYYKSMLERLTMQRTQQFSAFVCFRKNPVQCSACVVSRKNAIEWKINLVPRAHAPFFSVSWCWPKGTWALGTRLVKNWLLRDTPISREPLIRICRNLAQKYFWK